MRAGKTKLAVSDFYGKSRLRLVERCILRLLAAAQKKVQGIVDDPFQVQTFQISHKLSRMVEAV